MPIGDLCRRDVCTIRGGETVREAASRMADANVGCLVVVDGVRRPVGIVTDRNVACRVVAAGLDPDATAVDAVMSAAPQTVHRDESLEAALRLMRAGRFRRVPVVDDAGAVDGILTLDDVLGLLAGDFTEIAGILRAEEPLD